MSGGRATAARIEGVRILHCRPQPSVELVRLGFVILGISCIALTGCGRSSNQVSRPAAETNNPLAAPLDYIGGVGSSENLAARAVAVASVNQAIQIFRAQEDRYPKDLNELVTEDLLPELPRLPKGVQLLYDPVRGEAKISKQ